MGGVSDYFCAHNYRSLTITESAHLLLLETGILRGEEEGEELTRGESVAKGGIETNLWLRNCKKIREYRK